jgi:hypothetical protein
MEIPQGKKIEKKKMKNDCISTSYNKIINFPNLSFPPKGSEFIIMCNFWIGLGRYLLLLFLL